MPNFLKRLMRRKLKPSNVLLATGFFNGHIPRTRCDESLPGPSSKPDASR